MVSLAATVPMISSRHYGLESMWYRNQNIIDRGGFIESTTKTIILSRLNALDIIRPEQLLAIIE